MGIDDGLPGTMAHATLAAFLASNKGANDAEDGKEDGVGGTGDADEPTGMGIDDGLPRAMAPCKFRDSLPSN
eukprot:gene28881-32074_t